MPSDVSTVWAMKSLISCISAEPVDMKNLIFSTGTSKSAASQSFRASAGSWRSHSFSSSWLSFW